VEGRRWTAPADLAVAVKRTRSLRDTLRAIVAKDQEQEVTGIALPVIDAVLTKGRDALPSDDSVVNAIHGLITPETIAEGEAIGAVDALIVVEQLYVALKRLEPPKQRVFVG
jgi:hypothetical protein